MKHLISILLLLAAGNLCLAQSMNQGGPAAKHFYQEIPYQQINGKIIIEIEIAGHIRKFLLDTGAPDIISDEIAAQLNITNAKQGTSEDAVGVKAASKTATVNSLKIGNITFNNVPASIGVPTILACFGVEGIIGSNLLRNTIIQFNSKKHTVILTDDFARLPATPQNAIPLNLRVDKQSTPFFVSNITANITGDFFFDSGDNGFLALTNQYMDIFKKYNVFTIMATGYGGNVFSGNGHEQDDLKFRLKFPTLQIGKAVFTNVITETTTNNVGTGNRIGVQLLDHGTLTIDYLHKKLYFEPFTPQTDLIEKTWAVSPSFNDGKLIIGVVWNQLKGAINPGQQIIAIDDVSCEKVDFCDLITKKSLLNGKEHAVLTIKNEKGELFKLPIVKE
jgi:hypothetical protein